MVAGIEHPLALVLTGPSKAEVRLQSKESLVCGPGEAIVKIFAVGVCATDIELYDGSMGYFVSGLAAYPFVPGHEWAGELVQLGPGCPSHLELGQHVVGEHATGCVDLRTAQESSVDEEALVPVPPAPPEGGRPQRSLATARARPRASFMSGWKESCSCCSRPGGFLRCPERAETGFFKRPGAFSQLLRFPAKQLLVVPSTVPWTVAALSEPLATVTKAVRVAALPPLPLAATGSRKPPRIVVVGEGTIGLLALQVLLWRGYRVATIGASSSRLARAKDLGAEVVYNVAAQGMEGLSAALVDEGQPPEWVLECAGRPAAVDAALQVVAPGGVVVLMGLSGSQVSNIVWDDIVLRQVTVRGSLSSEPEDWRVAVELISSGRMRSLVTHTLNGLENYEKAIGMVAHPPEDMLKLSLLIQERDEDALAAESLKRQRVE